MKPNHASIGQQKALLQKELKLFGYPNEISDQDIDRCLKTSNWNANRVHQYYLLKHNGLMEYNSFEDWFSSYFFHDNYTVFEWNESFDHARINEMIQQEVLVREAMLLYCSPSNFSREDIVGYLEESSWDANSVYQYISMKFNGSMKYGSFEAWRVSNDFEKDYQIWFHWSREDQAQVVTTDLVTIPENSV